ncbi:MAG: protoporphyrinogen oxidase [Acidobacteriota bacterium]
MLIVGAGIGGLAAANRILNLARDRRQSLEVVVLEAASRAGGVLGTERHEGALLERGPDTLVTHKPAGLTLCAALGLGGSVVSSPPGRADILHNDRLLPVPAGFALLAPTRARPLLGSPLLSWIGKARALWEPRIRAEPPQDGGDESVASFVRRRFGAEICSRMTEPIVGGIYMADIERLSMAMTFPRFLVRERENGRIMGGGQSMPQARPGAPPSIVTLNGGLGVLLNALAGRLPPGSLRLNRRAQCLRREASRFVVDLLGGERQTGDAVLIATPADHAAEIIATLDSGLAERLHDLRCASCVTINLGWPRSVVTQLPRSHGFFVPRDTGSPLVAASFPSLKFPDRIPPEQFVARAFLGGALHPEIAAKTDDELIEISTRLLMPLLGSRQGPIWSRVFRHPQSMPQRDVGHATRVERIRADLRGQEGLELAGGPIGAYGVPDSIAEGEAAAERLFDWIVRSSRGGGG